MSEKQRPLSLQSSRTRQRLPTLAEVLARRTAPPVDLYCFYLYLQREAAEDALDFWLDVQQHENLCRAYFKDLRKSGKSVKEDWPQYYAEALERGSIYNKINGINEQSNTGRRGAETSWDYQSRVDSPDANYSTFSHAPSPVPMASVPLAHQQLPSLLLDSLVIPTTSLNRHVPKGKAFLPNEALLLPPSSRALQPSRAPT